MLNPEAKSSKAAHYTAAELRSVEEHIHRFFGTVQRSLADIGSDGLPLSIDVIATDATPVSPSAMLVTKGMGAHRMSVPEDVVQSYRVGIAQDLSFMPFERCELYMMLPPQSGDRHAEEAVSTLDVGHLSANSWPVAILTVLAQLPYRSGHWIGHGHVFTFKGEMLKAMPYHGAILLMLPPRPNTDAPNASASLNCDLPDDSGRVTFYQVMPLTAAELAYTSDLPYTSVENCMSHVHGLSVDRHYSSLECVCGPVAGI